MEFDAEHVHFGQDGLGDFDWSNKADDTPVSLALMATNSEVPYCSKCSKSYKKLLESYQTERDNFQKARTEILGYQMSLESLEVILKTHEKNEYAWGDKYEQMEYDLKTRDLKLEEKQKELDQALKERDDFKVKLEKWSNASVLQNEVLNKQRYLSDKTCIGFGVEYCSSEENNNSSGDETLVDPSYENFKREKAYKAVPPPTGTIIPPRANVSFTGIDELAIRNKVVNQEKTKTSQPEIDRNKVIIEDWVDSDDEETDFSEIQKKTVFNSENSETSFENKSPNSQNSVGQESRTKGLGNKGGKLCFEYYCDPKQYFHKMSKGCNDNSKTTWRPKGALSRFCELGIWDLHTLKHLSIRQSEEDLRAPRKENDDTGLDLKILFNLVNHLFALQMEKEDEAVLWHRLAGAYHFEVRFDGKSEEGYLLGYSTNSKAIHSSYALPMHQEECTAAIRSLIVPLKKQALHDELVCLMHKIRLHFIRIVMEQGLMIMVKHGSGGEHITSPSFLRLQVLQGMLRALHSKVLLSLNCSASVQGLLPSIVTANFKGLLKYKVLLTSKPKAQKLSKFGLASGQASLLFGLENQNLKKQKRRRKKHKKKVSSVKLGRNKDEGTLSEEHYVQEEDTADPFFDDIADKDAAVTPDWKETVMRLQRKELIWRQLTVCLDMVLLLQGPNFEDDSHRPRGLSMSWLPLQLTSTANSSPWKLQMMMEVARKFKLNGDAEEERKRTPQRLYSMDSENEGDVEGRRSKKTSKEKEATITEESPSKKPKSAYTRDRKIGTMIHMLVKEIILIKRVDDEDASWNNGMKLKLMLNKEDQLSRNLKSSKYRIQVREDLLENQAHPWSKVLGRQKVKVMPKQKVMFTASKESKGVDVDTLTMEQYLALSRENQAPGVVKPEIGGNVNFKIKSQFMHKLREDTFSRNKDEDAYDHIDRIRKKVGGQSQPQETSILRNRLKKVYQGPHLDKYCPLNEEVKQVKEVRYGEFRRTAPFNGNNGGKFHVGLPGYYTKIDNRSPYGEKSNTPEVLQHQLPPKELNLGSFTLPCTIDNSACENNPTHRSFDDYKWEFNLEIDKLADDYELEIGKKGHILDHIWEYLEFAQPMFRDRWGVDVAYAGFEWEDSLMNEGWRVYGG
ncbi:hypothetical protein Tco_0051214 [Tanacetum coccineum]